jgi:hypothetical protein
MRDHCSVRDGEDDGRGDSLVPRAPVAADDRFLDTPNCPDCLTRMEPAESPSGEAYWACTECGMVALA